jgi:CheY-like chemotaxis protein
MTGCASAGEALAVLRGQPFELLLADLIMPGSGGIELVQAARALDPDLACIIMTGEGSIASAVQAMQVGALDYILKPCKLASMLPVLARRALERDEVGVPGHHEPGRKTLAGPDQRGARPGPGRIGHADGVDRAGGAGLGVFRVRGPGRAAGRPAPDRAGLSGAVRGARAVRPYAPETGDDQYPVERDQVQPRTGRRHGRVRRRRRWHGAYRRARYRRRARRGAAGAAVPAV